MIVAGARCEASLRLQEPGVVCGLAVAQAAFRELDPGLVFEHLGWGVAVWLKADDPSALHDKLAAAGVAIITPPFEGPFGLTFAFEDPDGYIITIHG